MNYAYYVGEGPENDNLMDWVKLRNDCIKEARKSLMVKYGAERLMTKGENVYGLAWKEEQHERWKHPLCERDGFYVYNADRRYKEGKELYSDMHDKCVVDDVEEWLKKKLGVDHVAFGTNTVCWTFVGWNKGHLLVKVPDDGTVHNRTPKPPEWFREVTSTEWRKWNTKEEDESDEEDDPV